MNDRPRLLLHGYGLLDGGRNLIAGSRMSGLTLYTTFLVEGLTPSYHTTFLCGCLRDVPMEARYVSSDLSVLEYDARFSHELERNGEFVPELARTYYQRRVAEPRNPIYEALARTYARALSTARPDLINAHNPNAICAAVHAALRGVEMPPVLATIHDNDPTQLSFLARNQELIAGFIAISRAVETELLDAGIAAHRIHTIPNGLALQPFLDVGPVRWRDVARSHGLPEEPAFTVMVPARRVPGKGIDLALRAFDQVSQDRSEPVRLLVSGAGLAEPRYEAELRALASSLETRDSIHFLDECDYEELPALFKACDASLLPSTTREGFGYANVEAMATAGPVVVTTAHGGSLDYMIDRQNGLLVPPGDIDAIANALRLILDGQGDWADLRRNGRDTALGYGAEVMVASYDARIQSALAESRS